MVRISVAPVNRLVRMSVAPVYRLVRYGRCTGSHASVASCYGQLPTLRVSDGAVSLIPPNLLRAVLVAIILLISLYEAHGGSTINRGHPLCLRGWLFLPLEEHLQIKNLVYHFLLPSIYSVRAVSL